MVLFSKCTTVDNPCYEYVHPWEPSCFKASSVMAVHAFPESFKIYLTAYSLALLTRGKIPSKKDLIKTFLGILQSSVFLTTHGAGYSTTCCLLRYILGNFNFLTVSFIPSFLSSIVAILIERPSRRSLLSLYVTNLASETVYRMAVARGILKPVPYGEVMIFTISISLLMFFYRGDHVAKDSIYSIVRFIIGPYEESTYKKSREQNNIEPNFVKYNGKSPLLRVYTDLVNCWKQIIFKIKTIPNTVGCPHPYSCPYYVLQGGSRMFAAGYGLQLAVKMFFSFRKMIQNPKKLPKYLFNYETLQLGMFLSSFSMLYRGTSCSLRHYEGKDARYIALPAGLIAGLSFILYRGNTVALYFMWKVLQILYNKGVAKGRFVEIPHANVFFHALSTAILFHFAIYEPQHIRPSYWRFLRNVSVNKIVLMDRKVVDPLGIDATSNLARVMAASKGKH